MRSTLASTDFASEAPLAFAFWRECHSHSALAPSRNLGAPATVHFPSRWALALRVMFTDDTRSQGGLVPRQEIPAVQGRRPWPSKSVPNLSEIIASARGWGNRAEVKAMGLKLVSDPLVGSILCGRSGLSSTSQRPGREVTRRRSPSPMEVGEDLAHTPLNGARSRRDTRVTKGVAWGRSRNPTFSRARRGRGGEEARSEDRRVSGVLSHPPLLTNGAVPAPQDARRAAERLAQPGILSGSTPARTQQAYRALPSSSSANIRVQSPSQITPDTAPSFSDSSVGSQDARHGASSFDRRGLLRVGASSRSQQGCRAPLTSSGAASRAIHCPSIPTGAIPGSRDSNRGSQNGQRAVSRAFRRGRLGGGTPTES